MLLLFIFIIGLFVGSFLNVLADRLPRGEAVIKGRSRCEKCKKTLKWYDLIPLLSFIFLKGRCRYCKARLSFYYPTIEFVTGVLFAIAAYYILNNFQFLILNFYSIFNFKFLFTLFYYLFIVSSLIVVFFADLKYGIIPDKIVFPTIVIVSLYLFINHSSLTRLQMPSALADGGQVLNHLLSAASAGLFFLLLSLIKIRKHSAMGFGDVKFAFLMGLVLGFPNIVVSLYVAFLTGAIVGIILIIWRKKKLEGATISFGPFLVLGTFAALFWGGIILQKVMQVLR